ncbi:hypothetical protein KDI_54740 [Dictyobacter arantiisoli]|uniref:Uncharacterized protein n=2 Tax=Dictyobacter arantiisoli TaxID=2014874 RepID=A0A5A5TJW8_9CHLR|nr:hypothetical protein KDI_54740 [Dictyobacter arantiisoli]
MTLASVLPNENVTQCQTIYSDETFTVLHRALDMLTAKQKETVCRCFGLDGYATESSVEIGKEDNTTYKAVQSSRNKAIKQLRSFLDQPTGSQSFNIAELYTLDQACDLVGLHKSELHDVLYRRGIDSVKRGFYRKQDIEGVAQHYERYKNAGDVYTSAQVREVLGVSKFKAEYLISKYEIKSLRKGFYRKQDIDELAHLCKSSVS